MNGIEILTQVRQNSIPDSWIVFKGKRHVANDRPDVSDDDLPLLVITPKGIVEYVNTYSRIDVLSFADFKDVYLRVVEKHFDGVEGDITWTLIDLRFTQLDDTWDYWSPQPNFEDDEILIMQRVIEAFARYPLLFKHNSIN